MLILWGVAAWLLFGWPFVVEMARTSRLTPATIAIGHLALVVACFAAGVHDDQRVEWLTLLAALALLPAGWAFRRTHRAVKAAAGLALAVLTLVVFAWSTERIDHRFLGLQADALLWGTVGGIVLMVQAMRPAKPPPATATIDSPPTAEPTRRS